MDWTGRNDAKADEAAGATRAPLTVVAVDQFLAEHLHAAGEFARSIRPGFPRRVQISYLLFGLRIAFARLFDPSANGVLRFHVGVGRRGDGLRRCKALLLPIQAAIDHPLQDGGPFGLELLAQLGIALL